MCKLLVWTVDQGSSRRGDVQSVREDNMHYGEIPRQASCWRAVRVADTPADHPSIRKLLMRDRLPGKDFPERRFYLDIAYLENMAARKPGWTGSSDQAVVTNLLAIETATKVRFVPVTSLVVN